MPRRSESRAERRERRAEVEDPSVVMEAAAAFLAVRPRSVAETRRRLRHLGYRHALVEQVIERLLEMGYLDDAEFARAWVESRDRSRPRGEGALKRELILKGVPHETITELLEGRQDAATGEPVDLAAALRLIDRRRAALDREADPRKRRQRAYALLARNGFDADICREASARMAGADVVTEVDAELD
jgi:regulatory protein